MNPVTPTMSALQQAQSQQAVLQPQNTPLQGGQQPQQQQVSQGAAQNPLEQAFMQFLTQQHQSGSEYIKFLPWFSQQSNPQQGQSTPGAQQQIQQTAQQAFQPPQQQSSITSQAGSGQDLSNQATQNQVNRGGDMSTRFTGGYV